ncbi:hypothetical protein M5X00_29625 [Paenibacillus alvei]|uniref:hypothetical protein n=1 Tax=Paenibacillus alvei TaxID=44250 RepID=UPI0012F889F0|nr:hypothetical protein [Paenibacillus alvei]MCY9707638.1 hypothetical protein [Paenibacillus alvei]MCY9758381.1 hypothetical protein [Paenibacillus alvei]MEC0082850.1 hypothetical protein [Paenibacillus alvei]
MAGVALNNASIARSTASSHITYDWKRWDSCHHTDSDGDCVGGYDYYYGYSTSADIDGTCNATSNGVFVNGSNPVLQGDSTREQDAYSIPHSDYFNVRGNHSSANGRVSSGNGKNVFIGGKSVSISGSTVTTHAQTRTTINGGSSSNVFIGG